ncbi:regulator of volume decrease after cellular swelling-domain-containing protein [Ephemerocybe angulata]|uniref:Regulator of volume decrease after cellular swelling-domain-containing protein n=1 Tax=Ephemerocybe angulata TaxID=980116 RepID=A0A8H6HWK5_9AGAR|nr:regulator of volume decrease after cellular swelling-domain-containing protein [Tulosesus angulatus]
MPAITLVDAIPTYVSQEEYSSIVASTPSSFNDLPAILKHKEDDVSVQIQPTLEGFSEEDAAKGTLYVLTSVLVFASSTGRNFQIEYPSITLHAIQRSDSRPSIYCQLDEGADPVVTSASNGAANGDAGGEDEEANQEEEFGELRELNIIPSAAGTLDTIFESLSQCAALHPDKLSDDDDDLDDGMMIDDANSPFEIFTGDGDEELSEVGKVRSDFINNNRFAPY